MVIGNFRKIAGETRPLIAQIDVSGATAAVSSWHTDLYNQPCARSGKIGFMRDVDISPDGQTLYVVSAGHFYYPACDTANAFPMDSAGASDVQPIWSKKIGDTQEAVAASADTVYISGHFRYLETETRSEPRFQIAAVDAATGDGLNWIPNAGGFRGVLTLELEPAGLFAGSDGDAFGVVSHGRNAFWPAPAAGIEVRKAGSRRWILAPSGQVSWTIKVMNTYPDTSVQLTALSDSVLGNLNGAGTCAVPQSIPVGGSYSCTVPQTVTGTAGAQSNAGTVTATATPDGGGTVSDTDTALVDVLSSAPVFRTRLVLGPGQVQFPGATIRFSATLMNLDPVRSATLTTLTSPAFGDLSSQCGLPRPIGPNTLHYCHLDLPVEGSVGSRTTYTFTGSASYDTGPLSSSSGQTVTITPPVGGSKILVVVADPSALNASDIKLRDRLASNYALTFVDDNTAGPADVTPEYSIVIVGPSTVEARLGNRLAGVETPVLVTHGRMLDEMGMTAVGANSSVNGTTWDVTGWMHPLSTARSGTQTINTSSLAITWGAPEASADVISQLAAGQGTEFVYETGDAMTSGPAPACRVFFASGNNTRFTTTAWALFDRAVAYTAMACGKNMLWTAAGNGSTSYGTGDGRASVAVGLNTPWGIAVDSQNRMYVADAGTHAVRRIDPDGRVFTVAGTGTSGSSGDGGQATSARLNTPVRVAFDAAGNLYIADSGNNKIRKVTPAGTISTYAGTGTAGSTGDGGQATSARLRTPYDMAIAPDGTMYIADRANHKIRRVTSAGIISTVAGNGTQGYNGDQITATSARLNNPYSVTLDASGNLYIADYDNERVRVVSNGIIDTFAGTGVATADGDGGPANEAGLHKPQYVQVLPSGDMLISESNNNDVRIVHDGLIDLLAGSRQFGYSGDGGLPALSTWSRPSATAVDAQGNIWIADRGNRRVRVIESSN
jgi:sugar lactone lactonase YvrE